MPSEHKMYKNPLNLSSTIKNKIMLLMVVNDLKVLHGSRDEVVFLKLDIFDTTL